MKKLMLTALFAVVGLIAMDASARGYRNCYDDQCDTCETTCAT